jgi:phospholipid/cholesterol/gamma-HCH transport system permease protein
VGALINLLQRRGERIRLTLVDTGFAIKVLLWSAARVLPDGRHRRRAFLEQLKTCGLAPLPVVTVVGLFTGMILTLQVGVELERFGQAERISDIIAVILFREMGPFMTAMILTASVGSAMAAEIGTMAVSEEIDALECLSVDPISILVMPRIVAMAVMTPLLSFIGNIVGCLGGGIIASTQLDVSFSSYTRNVISSLQATSEQLGPFPEEIYTGLIKSVIFGIIIATVSCASGLKATGGALGVGRAVRTAVVRSFLMIIIIGYYISWMFFR